MTGTVDQNKEEWVRRTEQRLAELDRKIDELRARGAAAGDESVENLKQARDQAGEALNRAREASSDAWESTKRSASEAIDRLEAAYRGAAEGLQHGE